ncbi:MAG: replicative DNA helicase [Solirubrobacteraceae bacterium]
MSTASMNGARPIGAGVPPHNLEAERSVLGAILLDERHLATLFADERLRPEHFYREQYAAVFAVMLAQHEQQRKIDHLTVAEALRAHGKLDQFGGVGAVEELYAWVPAAGNAGEYARIVRENAQLRALQRATFEIQALIADRSDGAPELIEHAERLIFALRADESATRQRLLEDAVSEEIDRLEEASRGDGALPGLATGIPDLDRLLGGLQNGRLYVLAARPAMGKSLFALQLARRAATFEAAGVLFASLEMSDSETAQRHLAALSGVDPERLHLGRVRAGDWTALLQAANDTQGTPMHLLDDGDLSLMRLRAVARQLAARTGRLRLVVVDYLQLIRVERPTGNRVEDVSELSRGLKRLARELDCPVLAVAQLSRAVEQRPDKRPVLADLRESGQIEADADCVLMLYREDYYDRDSERPGEMDIIIRKNRQGRLGHATTRLDRRLRFLPLNQLGDARASATRAG